MWGYVKRLAKLVTVEVAWWVFRGSLWYSLYFCMYFKNPFKKETSPKFCSLNSNLQLNNRSVAWD